MIFTSFEFIAFFAVVLLLRALITNLEVEKWVMLTASLLFYMSWNPPFVLLLLFTSGLDFFVGRWLAGSENQRLRRTLLAASLTANLGVLAYFKYTNFALASSRSLLAMAGIEMPPFVIHTVLPAGISFFTFQSMSYTIDVYRRHIPPCRKLKDFLLFVSFFPQLVAGPIVRAADLLPQMLQRRRASWENIESGLCLFAIGAFKKLAISDQIAGHVEMIFSHPESYDALSLLLGALGFGIQIYCDFSGYSDMAIGCARIMGYDFCLNFRMPYSATSITEFWRRWHISLSTWLRDYLYISLGGNRLGPTRTQANLMITMLLGGLWHGASWNFVIWGGLHGLALVVHKAWQSLTGRPRDEAKPSRLGAAAGWLLTMTTVLVGWIFFRAPDFSSAWTMIARIATWQHTGIHSLSPQILGSLAIVAITHLAVSKDGNWPAWIVQRPMTVRIAAYTALFIAILCLGARESAPFIYFQF